MLESNGQRGGEVDTRYNADGTLFSKTAVTWAYDPDNRLTGETLTILDDGTGGTSNVDGHAPTAYIDTFSYDLANNRVEEDINHGDGVTGGQSIRYQYKHDDQLLLETENGLRVSDNNVAGLSGHVHVRRRG